MSKTAIVTGGSSGIGKAVAEKLSIKGYNVYEISRHGKDSGRIVHITADVSDESDVRQAVNFVKMHEKTIDLLVNAAGFGISGAAEFQSNDDIIKLLSVNLIGVSNMCKAVIPFMREAHNGLIINIGSIAGIISIPFQAWYSITKSGLNMYSLALSNELKPFGIKVTSVMLGDAKTGFTKSRKVDNSGDDIYDKRISRSVSVMEHDEQNGQSPEYIAGIICRIAEKKNPSLLYSVGFVYKLVYALWKFAPLKFVNYIVYKIYAK
ncbi:MAG: SDR family NAD(P)-dependent oxidoreductase [Ruminococcus sp.]|jgi:short-subunit dehydrogenase|nr:SDR family NAD(P)-dependent oxidoreductase [Ruminococcus sp.]